MGAELELRHADFAGADRMIWGGIGTLMEASVEEMLRKHADEIRRMGEAGG